MKSSSTFSLFLPRILSLATLTVLLHVVVDSAQAQRESFDATVIKERAEIAEELSQSIFATETVVRSGVDLSGTRKKVMAFQTALAFDNVYFRLDSTELRDEGSRKQLLEIAAALKHPGLASRRFLIEGHTCDLGEEGYNLNLSARRADAVRAFLVFQGIASERLAVLGFGEESPAVKITAKPGTVQCDLQRRQNRRVVLRALPPAK